MSIDVHHLILSDEELTAIERAAATIEAIERMLAVFGVDLPLVEHRPTRVLDAIVRRTRHGRQPIRLKAGDSS